VETVALLGRKKVDTFIEFDIDVKDIAQRVSNKATYSEIKNYVSEKYGFKISSLNIAQVKEKLNIDKRTNYYKGAEGHKVPKCTQKCEEAIIDAFNYFGIIQ